MIFAILMFISFWTIGYGIYLAFVEDKDREFNTDYYL